MPVKDVNSSTSSTSKLSVSRNRSNFVRSKQQKVKFSGNNRNTTTVSKVWCTGKTRTLYCVMEAFYEAEKMVGFNSSVTLTTQATTGFEHHVEQLCRRWQGPISVAVYSPGEDFRSVRENIEYFRRCRDACVREWVTWHLFYDWSHPPDVPVIKTSGDFKNNTISDKCSSKPKLKPITYVLTKNLPYPINVARNVARLAAKTKYVLASDVELYPSENIIPRFINLIDELKNKTKYFSTKRQVFVLPVFEVKLKAQPPINKEELRSLMAKKMAVSFHKYACDTCHRIPKLQSWLKAQGSPTRLNIFITTKRENRGKTGGWEPFFIGTNQDPLFDERLTWNGKLNKMQVALELCYLDYDLHILDDAFLVHAPGIKRFDKDYHSLRRPFMANNRRVFRKIVEKLQQKYNSKMLKNC
ncbi:beta-1,4-glucuronyltransferase 1-like isoform X2 [Tachypleus tridentatus]